MVYASVGLLTEIERCFYMGTSNLTLNLNAYLVGLCLDEKDNI
jgi:hypothetical protein